MQQVRRDRLREGEVLHVGFYGGAPPPPELLRAVAGMPLLVRVRPDLLSRDEARALLEAGAVGIELDALSFDDRALRETGRRYRGALVAEMAAGLRALGLRVGLVLAQGLPASSHESCLADAALARDLADTVRLHPVLVLSGSRLHRWQMEGLYTPLSLGEAITTCRAIMDLLEPDVQVIRVGMQPRPDGLGRAVAGPRHPSLRELVEARRTLDHLRALLDGSPKGAHIEIRCAAADETRARGPLNQHVRILRAELELGELQVTVDPKLPRGTFAIGRLEQR